MAEAAVQPAETKPEMLAMTRRNILVERETGFWAILVFVISSIGLGYSGQLPFSTLASIWPGGNLAVMIAVAAIFFLLYAYTFAAIGTLVPRFGADYVLASRVINPPLAFVSSWILVLFLGLWGGGLVAWIGKSLVPMLTQALSLVTFDKELLSIGDWAASPNGMVTLGTLGVVLIFLMLIFPPRVTHWVLLAGVVITVGAWLYMGYLFATAAPNAFQAGWDHLMGEGGYLEHVLAARSQGLKMDFSTGSTMIAGLVASLWLFSGSCTPSLLCPGGRGTEPEPAFRKLDRAGGQRCGHVVRHCFTAAPGADRVAGSGEFSKPVGGFYRRDDALAAVLRRDAPAQWVYGLPARFRLDPGAVKPGAYLALHRKPNYPGLG